jgi:indole-3-glycerol phosphate synthase
MKTTPGDSAGRGDVLSQIYAAKASVLARERACEPYDDVEGRALQRRGERRPFLASLMRSEGIAVIAEIKRASPSAGVIANDFDIVATAVSYAGAGANAVSVLTEGDYFLGNLAYLDMVRHTTLLPILRKDFLWTRYQIAQSAAYGADCVLLILAGLSDDALRECLQETRRYDLDALIEVHDESELERAVTAGAKLIGINNRDLRTLEVDLRVAERLLPKVPTGIVAVSESGIRSAKDAARLRAAGARGFLIGEAMMRAEDRKAFLTELRESRR